MIDKWLGRGRAFAFALALSSAPAGAAPASSVLHVPSSDVFPVDVFHARRGQVGGHASRSWQAFVVGGTTHVRSYRHADAGADPTVHVPSLAGASHRFVELGGSSASSAAVAAALVASLALDGVGATVVAADEFGRVGVRVVCDEIVMPPAVVLTDTRERGMWGFQRDDWGGGAGAQANDNGATNGTGSIYLGNPSSQAGMAGRAGRVIAVYLWARGGFAPLLAASTGPAYGLAPGAMTMLGEGLATAITDFGMASILAAPFAASANLWAQYRENVAGGPRYRLHGRTPEGRGDLGSLQQLIWDTTAPTSSATSFGASYSPTADVTYPIHIAIGVVFELQDASGNYPARGEVATWIGDQNTTASHGTTFAADPTFLTGETTHHRLIYPAWSDYRATAYRRAYAAAGSDETSRIAMYGPWASLAFPASPAPPLLADFGTMGTITPNAYTTLTLASPVELGTAAASGQHLSIGANYVRNGGAALAVLTLPVYLDIATGDASWLNCWVDDRATWHDDIPGASGNRAPVSGVTEYRTRNRAGMPNTDPTQTYPDPMAVGVGDDSPNAIAGEAVLVERRGFAVAA